MKRKKAKKKPLSKMTYRELVEEASRRIGQRRRLARVKKGTSR